MWKRIYKNYQRHLAFTFVELVIVAVIVSSLGGVAVNHYIKTMPKTRAAKAKHVLALIAEAEKMYKIDKGSYVPVGAGNINAAIGAMVTGINLADVDNANDFVYSVTGANLIEANNLITIGSCSPGSIISFNLSTGVLTVPPCYE